MRLLLDRFPSPVGEILLVHDEHGQLRALDFADYEARMLRLLRLHYGTIELIGETAPTRTVRSLDAYFSGALDATSHISTATGGTEFQKSVWALLPSIPSGTTSTYGDLAKMLKKPGAMRAVGLANGANPIAIVVPCHRVIGASGALTGFGGGLHRKRWLLEHEGVLLRSADHSNELITRRN
jgi:O-6-methylguanine DNA methyltransferase